MGRRYLKTFCEWFIFIYIACALEKPGEAIQGDLDVKGDAIIWAVKRYHFFFRPSSGTHFFTHEISAYFTPPLTNPTNDSIKPRLLFGSIWQGEIWTMFADYHANRLYYTDHRNNFIGVFDMKTKQHKKIFQGLAWGIDNIGVDWISGNVYWTDTNYNWIMMANRNFSQYKNIRAINSQIPAKIAIHPTAGFVYWSERHTNGCLIFRSDLQGRDGVLLHNLTSVKVVTSLSIDYAKDRLYWSERLKLGSKSSAIRYSDLKSEDHPANLVYNSSSSYFEGVAFYKDFLYVTDDLNKRILVIDADSGKLVDEERLQSFMFPRAITVYGDPQHFTNATMKNICANSTCQHLCVADHNSDNYTCHCSIGFQLQPDGKSCATSVLKDEFALVVDKRHSKLYQLGMLSPKSPQEVAVKSIKKPAAIDYDWNTQTVFWADHYTYTVSTYSLKTETETVIINRSRVDSIALDVMSGNMYFVNSEAAALFVANSEGKYLHTLHIDHIYKAVAMTIDPIRGYIYWSDWGQSEFITGDEITGVIRSSRLDGSDVKTITNSTSTPTGLTIDPKSNRLFWTQMKGYSISWINFDDGSTGEYKLPVVNKNQHPTDLAFWRDRLYITDKYSKQILSVSVENVTKNQNGSTGQVEKFGPTLFFEAASIHIYSSATIGKGSDVCQNSTCPQLCLPQHINKVVKAKCVCQDHFTYVESNNTCVQHGSTNDTRPPSFNNTCPDSYTVVIGECLEQAPVRFNIPTAVDDSGLPVTVKSMTTLPKMPIPLDEGFYSFHFVATDKSHNKAECRFSVRIIARRCFPLWILNPPRNAVVGSRSCGNRVGSEANVTCVGSSDVAYQYQCLPNGRWLASGSTVCPPPKISTTSSVSTTTRSTVTEGKTTPQVGQETSESPTTDLSSSDAVSFTSTSHRNIVQSSTTRALQETSESPTTKSSTSEALSTSQPNNVLSSTTSALQGANGAAKTNSGMIAGIVIALLVVLLGVSALVIFYKRRGLRFMPLTTNWSRSDDRVYLTENEEDKVIL